MEFVRLKISTKNIDEIIDKATEKLFFTNANKVYRSIELIFNQGLVHFAMKICNIIRLCYTFIPTSSFHWATFHFLSSKEKQNWIIKKKY